MKKITYRWLEKQGACPQQLTRFRRLWPKGMPITVENLTLAASHELTVRWLVWRLSCKEQMRIVMATEAVACRWCEGGWVGDGDYTEVQIALLADAYSRWNP